MKLSTELLKGGLFCLIWLCCLPLETNSNYHNEKNKFVAKSYKNIINEEMLLTTKNIKIIYIDNFKNEKIIDPVLKPSISYNTLSSDTQNNKEQKIPLILNKFHCTNDIYMFIDNLHSKNFNFVEVATIGHTILGTPLKIIKIKSDTNHNNSNIIWIDGGIHAREWITISSLIYIANELIYNRHSLPKYMKKINFVLMPIVNPDGYTYTHEKDRMWRKNRVGTNANGCMGVDLNRNWNYNWNSTNSGENSCSENYRGPAPNSELEIKSIIQFIEKNVIKMKGFITFHSYGQKIMYPWAYTNDHLKDYKELHKVAKSIALKIFQETLKKYTVGSACSTLYNISGSSIDWMKGIANIKYVFALELRDTGKDGFNLSTREIIPTGQEAFCVVSELTKHIVLMKSNGVTHFCIENGARLYNFLLFSILFAIFVFV